MPESEAESMPEIGRPPVDHWTEEEVWFLEKMPTDVPWGTIEEFPKLPEEAHGSFGIRMAGMAMVDGVKYREGELVTVETREEWASLLTKAPRADGFFVPWFDRIVPIALLSPREEQVDRASFLNGLKKPLLRSLIITGIGVAAAFYFPTFFMLALLGATFYGIFPLVEIVMAYFQRVDRLSLAELNKRLVNFELFRGWISGRRSWLVIISVLLLVAVFVGQSMLGVEKSAMAAGLVKGFAKDGEMWRILTGGLMHGNIVHILFNGMALFSLGKVVRAMASPSLFLIVFLAAVIAGGLASLYLGPDGISVGASGGIMGLLGFLLVLTYQFRGKIPGYLRMRCIQVTIVMAIFGLLGSRFIDNAAHGGGFLAGALLGILIGPFLKIGGEKMPLPIQVLGILCGAVLLYGLGLTGWELWKAGNAA